MTEVIQHYCRKCHSSYQYEEWDLCPHCLGKLEIRGVSVLGGYIVSLEKRIAILEEPTDD